MLEPVDGLLVLRTAFDQSVEVDCVWYVDGLRLQFKLDAVNFVWGYHFNDESGEHLPDFVVDFHQDLSDLVEHPVDLLGHVLFKHVVKQKLVKLDCRGHLLDVLRSQLSEIEHS